MCSAANVIYSNSHLRMCGYVVSVGKVRRIISASTSALYHFEHPHFTRGLVAAVGELRMYTVIDEHVVFVCIL